MAEATNILFKGVTTTITQSGAYQLVDNNPTYCVPSTIIVDMNLVAEGEEVNLILPTTSIYTLGFSGVINVIQKGGSDMIRTGINVYTQEREGDYINGQTSVTLTQPNGCLKIQLISKNLYGCDNYATGIK